jgi:hypothetical protein
MLDAMMRWVGIGVLALVGCGGDGGGREGSTSSGSTSGESAPGSDETRGGTTAGSASTSTSTSDGTTTEPESSTGLDTGDADTTAAPACGNGLCGRDEDASSCCEDCGVCDDGATVRMQTGVEGGAPGVGVTPGGVADTHAQFAGGSFAEVVYPFTIEEEPVAGSSWFWAQQFFFDGTTQGGYIGVQANGILGGQVVGKMMIGSIWDAIEATPGPSGSCEPFGGEGVGYSCRLPFEWRENITYRMVVRESAEDWWSIIMIDPTTNTETLLGDIHVPAEYGRIRPPTAGFAEYYGTVESCETLPHAVALLHAPTADGTDPTSVDAGTYGPCAAQATSTCEGPLCE